MKGSLSIALSISTWLFLACGRSEQRAQGSPSQLSATTKLAELEKRLDALENRNAELSVEVNQYRSALLDCGKPGYRRLDTNIGTLLVTCEDVQPFLDGFKLKLHLGNPSLLRYSGFEVHAKWMENMWDEVLEPEAVKSRTVSLPDELLPGTWSTVSIVIEPATAKELANLQVSIETDKLSLRRY